MEELLTMMGMEGIAAMIATFAVVFFIIMIAVYVYMSLAFMTIGRKIGLKTPELAWIPGVGPAILAYQSSKMHWWPWLLLIAFIIPLLNFFAVIAFAVFYYIWMWKFFEAAKRPGWWPLLSLIPLIGGIIFLILVGITAWGKNK